MTKVGHSRLLAAVAALAVLVTASWMRWDILRAPIGLAVPRAALAAWLPLIVTAATPSDAKACLGPDFNSTIFFDFDKVPSTSASQIVAGITITEVFSKPPGAARDLAHPDRLYQRALARVNHVIRGRLDTATITILAPDTDCDLPLTVGSGGLVVGEIRGETRGALQLVVESESRAEREIRSACCDGDVRGRDNPNPRQKRE